MYDNKYVKFKYNVSSEALNVIREIAPLNTNYIESYVNVKYMGMLDYMNLYLICDYDSYETPDGKHAMDYTRPLGIIGQNESDAMYNYRTITGASYCTCISELVSGCRNIAVEPM